MARRQILVQMDDKMIERLDELAASLDTNRSDLLRRGASALLNAARERNADQTLREAYRRVPQDPVIIDAARRLATETVPEW